MYKQHPAFSEPPGKKVKIWRYMDFTKFVSLLDKQELFFARADKLGDRFEGSFPKTNVELRPEIYKDKIPPNILKDLSEFRKFLLSCTVINCWHLNEYESAAMWKLYLRSNEGIAIQSTFNKLKSCFSGDDNKIHIGSVKYIDYDKEWIPESNTFYPFLHKRKSFEHEKELRAIIQRFSYKKNGEMNLSKSPFNDGIYIQVDLDTLINEIHLAPACPKWLFELVQSVTKRYGLDKDVVQSTLDEKPVY